MYNVVYTCIITKAKHTRRVKPGRKLKCSNANADSCLYAP